MYCFFVSMAIALASVASLLASSIESWSFRRSTAFSSISSAEGMGTYCVVSAIESRASLIISLIWLTSASSRLIFSSDIWIDFTAWKRAVPIVGKRWADGPQKDDDDEDDD